MATAPTDLDAAAILDALTYVRAIQVMAMLLIGFGFLMVFVRQYGRSAITATFLLVSLAIPLYYSKEALGIPLDGHNSLIERLVLSEFAAASLLIAAGAVLGRLTMIQYLLLGGLFLPFYVLDEWVLSQGGLGLIPAGLFVDTGGSILIHAFGALFGVAAAVALTRGQEQEIAIESDDTSDRFSLLGSMVLWVFWPSFCAALVPAAAIPATAVNVILALCASTLATYGASLLLRGKILPADIANAALAGGVAIGSTCDRVPPLQAFLIGLAAGLLSTFGTRWCRRDSRSCCDWWTPAVCFISMAYLACSEVWRRWWVWLMSMQEPNLAALPSPSPWRSPLGCLWAGWSPLPASAATPTAMQKSSWWNKRWKRNRSNLSPLCSTQPISGEKYCCCYPCW